MNALETLEFMIRATSDAVAARLPGVRQGGLHHSSIAEYTILRSLEQMCAVGTAVASIERNRDAYGETHTPATALGRIAVEGLVYINFLSDQDSDFRARRFICNEVMWREAFEDSGKGRTWRRRHGAEKQHGPTQEFITLPVRDEEEQWVDRFEREWICDCRERLLNHPRATGRDEESLLKLDTGPGQPLAQLRSEWLNMKLSALAQKEHSKLRTRWNRMCQWPFGLTPTQASEAGRLAEKMDRIVLSSGSDGAASTARRFKEWVLRMGQDILSELTHFSPARIAIQPGGFDNLAAVTHMVSLWMVVRLIAGRYEWAQNLARRI